VFFVRKSGTKFDIFDVSYGADPSTEATRVTTDSNVIGGINMYPDGTKLFYTSSVKSGSTDVNTLTELTIATGDKRAFGDASDEQARPFSGGDKLVVTRHSFDSDAEIAIIGTDGKLIKRLTDNMVFDTAPDASPIESADVSLAKF
jgi:hypothetical protein